MASILQPQSQDIKEGLEAVGHIARSASNITYKKKIGETLQTIKLPLFFVDVEPRPNNKRDYGAAIFSLPAYYSRAASHNVNGVSALVILKIIAHYHQNV